MATSITSERKRHGRHYTPAELAEFLAKRGVAYIPAGKKLRILDPACGDGELLLSAADALMQHGHAIAELVGLDLDEDAVSQARDRLAGFPALLAGRDFVRTLDEEEPLGEFDLVITNPPYVRTQVLGSEVSRQLAARFHLKGRIDLTHAFVAMMTSLLAPGGVIALLCSNRFLSTKAGMNTRQTLAEDYLVHEVYDLGDTKLFEAAVLPAIVIASRRGRQPKAGSAAQFTRIYETPGEEPVGRTYISVLAAIEDGAAGKISVGRKSFAIETGILVKDDPRDPWQLGQGRDAQWIADVTAGSWRTYGDVAKIRVGIKTTADSVFIRNDWKSLPQCARPESDLLLPLITHYDTRAWRVNTNPATRVLYPYDLTANRRSLLSLVNHPRTRAYLKSHEERLRKRLYVTNAGREWYEIWVPQRPSKWIEPKIVFPDISERPQFAIDKSGAVVNGDCYWISCADLPSMDIAYLMLAVANSSLGTRFYDTVCGNKLYSGKRRWITQYVEKLPLPNPTCESARKAIDLARRLSEMAAPAADDPATLAELDALVEEAFLGSREEKIVRQPYLQLSILDVSLEPLEL